MNEKDSPCSEIAVTTDLVDCLSKARDSSLAKLNSLYQRIRKKLEERVMPIVEPKPNDYGSSIVMQTARLSALCTMAALRLSPRILAVLKR
jgi:hypothetical protein